ncbi:unnamed protein product [Arctogadus glacialis]
MYEMCKFNTSRKGVEEMRRAIATALLENTDDLTEVATNVDRQTIQKQTRTYNGFPVNGANAGIIRAV